MNPLEQLDAWWGDFDTAAFRLLGEGVEENELCDRIMELSEQAEEDEASREYIELTPRGLDVASGLPQCRECGCTDNSACEQGCYWIEADLCSSCAPEAHSVRVELLERPLRQVPPRGLGQR